MTFELALGPRIAKSPFFDCTVAAGANRFSVYNHMLLPMSYGDELAEYWRLIDGVVMWDVAVQVQVELAGPDAGALAQAVVCRDLSRVAVGQAKYAPMVDHSQIRADGRPQRPSHERSAGLAGGVGAFIRRALVQPRWPTCRSVALADGDSWPRGALHG